MKILLLHGGVMNMGDWAIADSIISQMKEAFPGSQIVLEAQDPGKADELFSGVKVVPKIIDVSAIDQTDKPYSLKYYAKNFPRFINFALRYVYALLCPYLPRHRPLIPILREYKDADIIISVGGDFFSEHYGPGYRLRFYELFMARRLNKPLILYAQTLGPFSEKNKGRAKKYLSMADLIITRDQRSSDYLKELGVNTRIETSADAAVSLPQSETERIRKLTQELDLGSGTVGFVLLGGVYLQLEDDAHDSYIKGMAELVGHVKKRGLRPLLIAATGGDLGMSRKMKRRFNLDAEIFYCNDYSPREVKFILARLRALVSSRMHPVIMASTAGTPVLGINKLFKLEEYMKRIEQSKYYLSMEPLDLDKARLLLDELINNHQELRQKMSGQIKVVRALSDRNPHLVKQVFDNYESA